MLSQAVLVNMSNFYNKSHLILILNERLLFKVEVATELIQSIVEFPIHVWIMDL